MMLFTIVVPCFNLADYLPEALESVLAQTYPHWECLIVNDGSTDHAEEVAKQWAARDSRFKLLNKANGGLSSARNFGIKNGSGDYFIFLDADDVLYDEYLARAADKFAKTGAEILLCGFNFDTVKTDDRQVLNVTRSNFLRLLSRDAVGISHSFVVSRALVARVGLFDETLPSAEDWDYWARAGKLFPQLATIDYVGAGYRLRPGSMSRNAKVMLESSIAVARRVRELDPRLPADQRVSREPIGPAIVHLLMKHCGDLLFSGKRAEAEGLFRETVGRYRPTMRPQDAGGLLSYLVVHDASTLEARIDFWSKHVATISEFLLSCEEALQQRGFYDAAMTYLTTMWLQPSDMEDIIPFIRTKHLLRGGAKKVASKALEKLQISLGVRHAKHEREAAVEA